MKPLSDAAVERLRGTIDHPRAGDRYVVHEMLGRGGMGAVYRAYDTVLCRDVALKVLASEAEAPSVAARMARESRVLALLEHPGIVTVHDAGALDDGRPFYVMRLVRGKGLDDYAPTAGRGELFRVFLRICDAVAYAHSKDVIHRDLTPTNVMIGEFGEVLVLDWGVAKVAGDAGTPRSEATTAWPGTTGEGMVLGTPGFMAPEQAIGAAADADARADVYGLGAILKFLAEAAGTTIPRPLAAIIGRATATNPDARYAAVADLADDVRNWLDGEKIAAYRESVLERAARLYRRNQALILVLLAYAVVRVIILLWRRI